MAPPRRARLLAALPLGLALLGGACAGRASAVVELSPGVFALTQHAPTAARAARLGVAAAEAHCATLGRTMEPVRTEIGANDYRIAFRCLAEGQELILSPVLGLGP